MRPGDLPEIRRLSLFETMQNSSFERLLQAAYLQIFPAQLTLIHEGDSADFLYIVMDGMVELFANSNGREASMTTIGPFGTFILAAALKDAIYLMSARTLERSKILLVPSQDVREAFENDDAFARAIVVELANCYRSVVKDLKNIKLRTGVERLANYLIRFNIDERGSGRIELPYGKRTLASLLGMTPENLSRAFATLKPYGVKVDGTTILLNDLKSLEVLAKPNPLVDDPVR